MKPGSSSKSNPLQEFLLGHGTIALIELLCVECFGGRVISSNSGPQVLGIRI